MPRFLGIDLGWYGKPSGVASIELTGDRLSQRRIGRPASTAELLGWIDDESADDACVVAVDAPLVIRNATGIRVAERELNRDFRRYDAGCHPANLARPFAGFVTEFSGALAQRGFQHDAAMRPGSPGRFQIEVHPHAAAVRLFALDRIVKYKRGLREVRARELDRLRTLMMRRLPLMEPWSFRPELPSIPPRGPLKPVEDQIDAVLCAFIAAHWWLGSTGRSDVYGTQRDGFIVVPKARV